MRADRANRAFVAAAAMAGVGLLALGVAGCGALMLAVDRLLLVDEGAGMDPGLVVAVAMGLLGLVVSARGLRSVHRQLVATERLAQQVSQHRVTTTDSLATIASQLRIGRRIDLVDGEPALAFTFGFLRPHVVVSRGLIDQADAAELRAVLEHESYHARNFDPLKLVVVRAASDAFFFLPAIRRLTENYVLDRELAADRRAVARVGTKPLAAALVNVLGTVDRFESHVAAALGGTELLSTRVEQLETGQEPPSADLSRSVVVASATALAIVVAAGTLVRVLVMDSMPGMMGQPMAGRSLMAPVTMLVMLVPVGIWLWAGWRIARWVRVRPR